MYVKILHFLNTSIVVAAEFIRLTMTFRWAVLKKISILCELNLPVRRLHRGNPVKKVKLKQRI
jgi:hypothetical protein